MRCTNTHLKYRCIKYRNHDDGCLSYKGRYSIVFGVDFIFKNSTVTAAWLDMGWK